MRDASEGVEVPMADLVSAIEGIAKKQHDWEQKWAFGLVIANGAALSALGARVLETSTDAAAALAMPSLWAFALGLVFAGGIPVIEQVRMHEAMKAYKKVEFAALKDPQQGIYKGSAQTRDPVLSRLSITLQVISMAAFVAGTCAPLVALWSNHLHSGRFFPKCKGT